MPTSNTPTLIPLRDLLKSDAEDAVWHAAFGSAYALLAARCDVMLVAQDPAVFSGITRSARLIAQAAVLEYRKLEFAPSYRRRSPLGSKDPVAELARLKGMGPPPRTPPTGTDP